MTKSENFRIKSTSLPNLIRFENKKGFVIAVNVKEDIYHVDLSIQMVPRE